VRIRAIRDVITQDNINLSTFLENNFQPTIRDSNETSQCMQEGTCVLRNVLHVHLPDICISMKILRLLCSKVNVSAAITRGYDVLLQYNNKMK